MAKNQSGLESKWILNIVIHLGYYYIIILLTKAKFTKNCNNNVPEKKEKCIKTQLTEIK